MIEANLYRRLVPDAPSHRRSEGDRRGIADLERAAAGQLDRPVEPGLQQPSLISSWRGAIERLLFVFPKYGVEDGATSAGYQSIIRSLRSGTKFVVVHHRSQRSVIEGWFADGHDPESVVYVPAPDYVSLTDWAEDAYVSLTDAADGSSYLVEPWQFPRAGDALIAEYTQEYAGIRASQAPLIFQGGNCLIGDDFWLLGKDYFADSLDLLAGNRPPVTVPDGTAAATFARKLFADYIDADRKLLLVGTKKPIPVRPFYGTRSGAEYYLDIAGNGIGTFQPIFHIDMFITLIGPSTGGRFRVLVGSPALADELLGTQSPVALQDVYDSVARDLDAAGCDVQRNPLVHRPTVGQTLTVASLREHAARPDGEALLPAIEDLLSAGATDDTRVRVRDWHHITWNNCLVENSDSVGHHVYLPTYGHGSDQDLAPIDAHMKALWEGLDFNVHMLGDFNPFARRQGVVHCLKKYLARGT